MNISEVRVMLEFIKAHEPTQTADNIAAQAWFEALKPDMPSEFARGFIARYYSQPDRPRLNVGALNNAWYWVNFQDPTVLRLEAARAESCEMPEWFKEQFKTMMIRSQ